MNTAFVRSLLVALAVALPIALPSQAFAASKSELNASSKRALDKLVASVPAAAAMKSKAVAILVFPSITKAGFMIGGQYGDGVLWQGGKPVAYYNTSGASYGLQAGAQKYGYAMFFMNKKGSGRAQFVGGLRGRRRPERGGHGPGNGQEHDDQDL